MTFGLVEGFGALVAGALLLQRAPRRWPLAGIGALAYGLATAALLPEATFAADIPGTFGRVNAGLLLLGVVLAVVAGILASREATTSARRGAALAAGGAGLLAVAPAIPFVAVNGTAASILYALLVGAAGTAFLVALRYARVAHAFQWLDRRWLAPPSTSTGVTAPRVRRGWLIVLAAATAAIVVAPLAIILVGWCVVMILGLHALRRTRGAGPRWPFAAIGIALLLGWVLRWLIPIAGGGWSVGYAAFVMAPVSPAAAVMLVPAVLVAGWLAIGLWPVQRLGPGPTGAVAAAFILAGIGQAMLADGVAHAAPLIGMALVLAAVHAAATDDPARLIGAVGVLGILGVSDRSHWLLQGVLLLATIGGVWSWELRPARWGSVVWSVVGALAAFGGLWIVSDALRVETVSSTLVVLAAVAMLARRL